MRPGKEMDVLLNGLAVYGADPNLGTRDGVRPLAAAFLKHGASQERIFRLLPEYGTDPDLADKPSQAAFDFAQVPRADPALAALPEKAETRLRAEGEG